MTKSNVNLSDGENHRCGGRGFLALDLPVLTPLRNQRHGNIITLYYFFTELHFLKLNYNCFLLLNNLYFFIYFAELQLKLDML